MHGQAARLREPGRRFSVRNSTFIWILWYADWTEFCSGCQCWRVVGLVLRERCIPASPRHRIALWFQDSVVKAAHAREPFICSETLHFIITLTAVLPTLLPKLTSSIWSLFLQGNVYFPNRQIRRWNTCIFKRKVNSIFYLWIKHIFNQHTHS